MKSHDDIDKDLLEILEDADLADNERLVVASLLIPYVQGVQEAAFSTVDEKPSAWEIETDSGDWQTREKAVDVEIVTTEPVLRPGQRLKRRLYDRPAPPAPPTWIANCVECGHVLDTREADEGGDKHGCQLDGGAWVCSGLCWTKQVEPDIFLDPMPLEKMDFGTLLEREAAKIVKLTDALMEARTELAGTEENNAFNFQVLQRVFGHLLESGVVDEGMLPDNDTVEATVDCFIAAIEKMRAK